MDFSSIVRDIQSWERESGVEQQPSERSEQDSRAANLIRLWVAEIYGVAPLMAVSASIANIMEKKPLQGFSAKDLADFVPARSASFEATVASGLQDPALAEVSCEMISFLQRLDLAKTLTRRLQSHSGSGGCDSDASLEIHGDAWRRTCGCVQQIVGMLESLSPVRDLETIDRTAWLVHILARATAGESPCVDTNGNIEIPGWAERRKQRRKELKKSAVASFEGGKQEVTILDASIEGLGIGGQGTMDRHVQILLSDGRELSGTIKWVKDDRYGLQLDVPLAKSDPLLVEFGPGSGTKPASASD